MSTEDIIAIQQLLARANTAVDAGDGAGAAWLHAHGEVLDQVIEGTEATYEVRLSESDYERFNRRGA